MINPELFGRKVYWDYKEHNGRGHIHEEDHVKGNGTFQGLCQISDGGTKAIVLVDREMRLMSLYDLKFKIGGDLND